MSCHNLQGKSPKMASCHFGLHQNGRRQPQTLLAGDYLAGMQTTQKTIDFSKRNYTMKTSGKPVGIIT